MEHPEVVYEDHHLLALAKPFGMPTQRDKSGDPALIDWATDYLGYEPHLLHRLDRPTGGLVLLGKTLVATQHFSRQFAGRQVLKVYLAITSGQPENNEQELFHHIAKLPGKNFVRAYDKKVRHSKEARLKVKVIKTEGALTLLEIHPFTGRRHQIRAQLRTIKLPIVGDQKYGKGKPLDYPGIALWAHKIEAPGIETKLKLEAPLPPQFPWSVFY